MSEVRPKVLDLFCGAVGAWSLGMHRAGYETIAACEIDPWRRAIYGHNNPGVTLYDDVRSLTADRLRADLGRLPDIVVGSPPCQDASSANTKGKGVDGERTGLFFEAIRIARECRAAGGARWVALENSPMLRTRGYDRLHDALRAAGYTPWPAVVGADDLGAPHKRKRVWIVALDTEGFGPGRGRAWGCRAEGIVGVSDAADASDLPIIGCGARASRQFDPSPARQQDEQFARQSADANGDGIRVEPGRRGRQDGEGAAIPPHAADPDCDPRSLCASDATVDGRGASGQRASEAGNANGAGSSLGESLGSGACAQLAALERAIGSAIHSWDGGAARHLRMAHGVAARLADIRVPDHRYPGATINAAKACISAQGDAILPQIAEAIGRAILRTEAALAAVSMEHSA